MGLKYEEQKYAIDLSAHKASFYSNQVSDLEQDEIYYEAINSRGVFYLLVGDTSPMKQQVLKDLKKELENSLLLYEKVILQAEIDHYSIKVTVSAKRKIILPIFSRILRTMENANISANYPVHRPAETIRSMEVIMNTASEIKGVSELKEKLEKFLQGD
ncbi:MAG: putative rane protein [Herbinix sp.]|nr:putative rane protein [Herbinix sp.]